MASERDGSAREPMLIATDEATNRNEQTQGAQDSTGPTGSVPVVGFIGLYRYASPNDRLLIIAGTIFAIIQGGSAPAMSFFMKDLFQSIFWPNDNGTVPPTKGEHHDRDDKVWNSCATFLVLAAVAFAATGLSQLLFARVADRMALVIRKSFFDHLLRKDVGWYDTNSAAEMATRLSNDAHDFREGTGQKLTQFIAGLVTSPVGFAIAFYQDWRLTLMLLGAIPLMSISFGFAMKTIRKQANAQQEAYAKAGAVAETTIGAMRTVAAFDGYERELKKYDTLLAAAEKDGAKTGWTNGVTMGFTAFVMYAVFGLGFFLGSLLLISDYESGCWKSNPPFGHCFTGATMLSTLFAVLNGGMGLGMAAPYFSVIVAAKAAAGRLYAIIDDPPAFDADVGEKFEPVLGKVEFRGVVFHYPTRPDVAALDKASFTVPAGSTTAFVGPSGSGKSTIISLLQRFYDTRAGSVCLDGRDIRGLNLTWLRSKMSLVQQEPVLFSGSIHDNISYGLPGSSADDVIVAAKSSNAHGFISDFPKSYKTEVGERGLQLSGGQKQRVAIARAIIRDPSILLLDEATSALDNESERVVQKALDDLLKQKSRTTLVIAHRLSTVRDSNQIIVLENGHLLESGTHDELMARPGGLYAQLVELQAVTGTENPQALLRTISQNSAISQSSDTRIPPQTLVRKLSDNRTDNSTAPQDTVQIGIAPPRRSLSTGSDKSDGGIAPPRRSLSTGSNKVDGASTPSPSANASPQDMQTEEQLNPPEDDDEIPVPISRLWELQRKELWLLIIALSCTVPVAVCRPLMGYFFGDATNLYSQPPAKLDMSVFPPVWRANLSVDELRSSANWNCLEFVLLGAVMFVSTIGQYGGFRQSAEALTRRLRLMTFKAMMRQEMAWFDARTSGHLADRLATEVPLIKAFSGESLAAVIQLVFTIGTGLGLALWYSWRLTLTSACFLPLVSVGMFIMMREMRNAQKAKAAPVVSEAMGNIKTVAAFSLQSQLQKLYEDVLVLQNKEERRKSNVATFAAAWTTGIQYVMFGGVIFAANIFISQAWILPSDVLQVLFPILFCASGAAIASQWQGDKAKAQTAVNHIFHTLDRTPEIDAYAEGGGRLDKVVGTIEFKHVAFNYPTRPDIVVFSDFDLKIDPKTTVALVGPSGSGKSTAIALLQRFYNTNKGSVCLDGHDIRELNLCWLRSQMAYVQQEPVLFTGTILENIAYGRQGASEEECIAAAKASNADGFITGFPKGYGTEVGDRGSQISGGQKQRIAIARSMVRDPAVLLLDEATSALDSESERIVQEALDKLLEQSNRTTLIVAHRLSTIKNADVICVIYQGRIVEKGTHNELIKINNGHYAQLAARQESNSEAPGADSTRSGTHHKQES